MQGAKNTSRFAETNLGGCLRRNQKTIANAIKTIMHWENSMNRMVRPQSAVGMNAVEDELHTRRLNEKKGKIKEIEF